MDDANAFIEGDVVEQKQVEVNYVAFFGRLVQVCSREESKIDHQEEYIILIYE